MGNLKHHRLFISCAAGITLASAALALNGTNASAEIRVTIEQVSSDGKTSPAGWSAKHGWMWVKNADSVQIIHSLVKFSVPGASAITDVNGKTSVWQSRSKPSPGSEVTLLMSATQDTVSVVPVGGQPITVRVSVVFDKQEEYLNECASYGMEIRRPAPLTAPFYLAFRCQRKDADMVLTVIAPEDVQWRSTTIFEVGGKGERWRQYLVQKSLLATGGEIGRLTLAYRGKAAEYELLLRSRTVAAEARAQKEAEAKRQVSRFMYFRAGIGGWQIAFTTPRVQTTAIQPGLTLFAETRPLLSFFQLGASLNFAVPFSPVSDDSADFFEFRPTLGVPIRLGKGVSLIPRAHFTIMSSYYDSGTLAIKTYEAGLNVEARISLSQNLSTWLGALEAGHLVAGGAKVIGGYLGVDWPTEMFLASRFGIEARYQGYSLTGTSGSANTVRQIMVSAVLGY